MKVLSQIGRFISEQVLGMKWLNELIGKLISLLFGDEFLAGNIGGSIQFFVYDTIKIFVLLCFLIFIISYIQSYFPPERSRQIIGKFKGIKANMVGALIGILTPFCSCSSIPLFIGFSRAGLPVGVTFSFLIASPLIDIGAFILLTTIFGFPIAITYVIVGFALAVIGGTIIDKTGLGKHVEDFVMQGVAADSQIIDMTKKDRLIYAKDEMFATLKKIWLYVIIGVGIGSVIHNWIPQSWVEAVLGLNNPFSVLIATVIGIPMYANIFGTIPVAEALFMKGVGVGTILAFMMSVTALSLPSMIMLRRAIKPKLLGAFIVIITIGVIIIGYLFNALNSFFV